MPDVGASRYASYMLSEVEKIRRYLGSLRLLNRETPLDVYILSHGVILEDLDASIHRLGQLASPLCSISRMSASA